LHVEISSSSVRFAVSLAHAIRAATETKKDAKHKDRKGDFMPSYSLAAPP